MSVPRRLRRRSTQARPCSPRDAGPLRAPGHAEGEPGSAPGDELPGAAAEALAASYLAERGLAIVARNWRTRRGEIDLIARDGATLVFVEVRLRRNARFGGAAASITAAKRARLVAAAEQYLAALPAAPACRFDAILLDALDARRIEWLRDVITV